MAPDYRRRRIGDSHYEILVNGVVWGDVVKTGTHLDDYPWDWSIAETHPHYGSVKRSTGTAETLRNAANAIIYAQPKQETV